jgi:hypothetical protein
MSDYDFNFVRICVPHSTQSIFDLDISELLVAKCLDFLQEFTLCRQNFFKGILEIQLRGRGVVACLYYSNETLTTPNELRDGQLHTRDEWTRH